MDVKTTFRNLVRDQSVSICMLQFRKSRCTTGINDTGGNDTVANLLLVSTTPAANLPLVSTTPAANFATSFASVVDTGGNRYQ